MFVKVRGAVPATAPLPLAIDSSLCSGQAINSSEPFYKYANLLNDIDLLCIIRASMRFCIIDCKEIVFMIMDDEKVHPGYDIAIWVTTPFFSNMIEERLIIQVVS